MNSPEMVAAKRGKSVEEILGNKPWQRLLKLLKPAVQSVVAETQGNAAWPGSASYWSHRRREDTPAIRGMINAVSFMVKVRSKRCV